MGRVSRTMLVLFCLMSMTAGVSATVYKCVDVKGNATFSDRPCSPSAEVVQKGSRDSNEKKKSNTSSKKAKEGWGGYLDRARKTGEGNSE